MDDFFGGGGEELDFDLLGDLANSSSSPPSLPFQNSNPRAPSFLQPVYPLPQANQKQALQGHWQDAVASRAQVPASKEQNLTIESSRKRKTLESTVVEDDMYPPDSDSQNLLFHQQYEEQYPAKRTNQQNAAIISGPNQQATGRVNQTLPAPPLRPPPVQLAQQPSSSSFSSISKQPAMSLQSQQQPMQPSVHHLQRPSSFSTSTTPPKSLVPVPQPQPTFAPAKQSQFVSKYQSFGDQDDLQAYEQSRMRDGQQAQTQKQQQISPSPVPSMPSSSSIPQMKIGNMIKPHFQQPSMFAQQLQPGRLPQQIAPPPQQRSQPVPPNSIAKTVPSSQHVSSSRQLSIPSSSYSSSSGSSMQPASAPAPRMQLSPEGLVIVAASIHRQFIQLFPYREFNRMQSSAFPEVFHSDQNLVLTAPTGSGKTVIFELAMVRLFASLSNWNGDHALRTKGAVKVIYMAPIKALVQEKISDWKEKFSKLGIVCRELTGDSDLDIGDADSADVILTTPEKWDSVTRRWKGGKRALISSIGLLMIDEVHLLHEDRGAILEAVISRMKTIRDDPVAASRPISNLRIVAVSATIPNIEDIAEWLQAPPSGTLKFGDEFRPVKLDTHVLGFPDAVNHFAFEKNLNFKMMQTIKDYSNGRPCLIFCNTRKNGSETAQFLVRQIQEGAPNFVSSPQQRDALKRQLDKIKTKEVKDCLPFGIGIHHAGLENSDRRIVEQLFLDGHIMILCATTTLAQGVNLPAHCVILKSTKYYDNGDYKDFTEMQMTQMLGRAGRVKFDSSGVAVIMTEKSNVEKFKAMLAGAKETVESNLHCQLTEHLNAEIALQTITNVDVAVEWLKGTFLFVRMRKNPAHYGILSGDAQGGELEQKMMEFCLQSIDQLALHRCIEKDAHGSLKQLVLGVAMNRFYVRFETVKNFSKLEMSSNMQDLLRVIAGSEEFQELRPRTNEKKSLNAMNEGESVIRFPIREKTKVKDREDKVFVLLQAALQDFKFQEYTLNQDMHMIAQSAPRICKCLVEFCVDRMYGALAHQAISLQRCLKHGCWEDNEYQFRQFTGIGPAFSSQLFKAGFTSIRLLTQTPPWKLESVLTRRNAATTMVAEISKLPKCIVSIQKIRELPGRNIDIEVSVTAENLQNIQSASRSANSTQSIVCIVVNQIGRTVAFRRMRSTDIVAAAESGGVKLTSSVPHEPGNDLLHAYAMLEDWIGFDCTAYLSLPSLATAVASSIVPPARHLPAAPPSSNLALPKPQARTVSAPSAASSSLSYSFQQKQQSPVPMTREQLVQQELQQLENFDIFDEDLAPPSSVPSQKLPASTPSNPKPRRRTTPAQRGGCSHFCKDKAACKHDCCKIGLADDAISYQPSSAPLRVPPATPSRSSFITSKTLASSSSAPGPVARQSTGMPSSSSYFSSSAPSSNYQRYQNPVAHSQRNPLMSSNQASGNQKSLSDIDYMLMMAGRRQN